MNDIMMPKGNAVDPLLAPAKSKKAFVASPRDLLFILFWHRRKVVGFFTVATLLTALAVLALPSTYRSESKLLVKMGSDTISPNASSSFGGPIVQPVIYWEVQMKTELEVLRSREVAVSVVNQLGAGTILRKGNVASISPGSDLDKQALLALQNNLSLEVVPDSSILMVAYQSGDGKLAHDITEAYVDRYLALRSGMRDAKDKEFLEGQKEETVKKVQELEEKIRNIQDEAGVGNIAESRQLLQNRIGALESDLTTAKANSQTSEAEAAQIKEQLKSVPEHVVSETKINTAMGWKDELKKDIGKLEIELADAKARFADGSPHILILEQKIEKAREALNKPDDNERTESLNEAYKLLNNRMEEARANAAMFKTKSEVLSATIAESNQKLKAINDVELKINQLKRSSNLSEETLHLISTAADRADLLSAFQDKNLNNVSVVQPATLPLKPVAPNRLLLLMIGMFVAATGAVGLGIISETLSKTAKRPEDIDRLSGLPSVSVPVIDSPSFIGAAGALGTAISMASPKRLLSVNKTDTQVEMLPSREVDTNTALIASGPRVGETRLQRRWSPQLLQAANGIIDGLLFDSIHDAKNQQAFVTGVISCRPGQGASTLSSYIASAIADRLEASLPLHPDDRVLLVDADINEPSLHRILSVDDTPGLGDWLSISNVDAPPVQEFLHPTLHSRLSVMPGGRSSSLTRLLDRVDLLIDEATRGHRHIVLDLPPVSTTPTSLRLAAKCTAVLLVVECGNLHQEVVRRSVAALQSAGANVCGVILNKRRFPIPDWLYERAS